MGGRVIGELLDGYRAAVAARDVDAFVALYDDDLRVYDLWGRWTYEGIDAWRQMVSEWFGSLGDERVVVELDEVRTTDGEDVAVASGVVTFRAFAPDGAELRGIANRATWAARRSADGVWRIVHEHTSVPLDLETSRPLPRQ
jgi:uncharacterized protein (TIGR02246 family)